MRRYEEGLSLIKIVEQANATWLSASSGAGDLVVMRFCPIPVEAIDIPSPRELCCSMDMDFVIEIDMVGDESAMQVCDAEGDMFNLLNRRTRVLTMFRSSPSLRRSEREEKCVC